jgi:hypothetical protein
VHKFDLGAAIRQGNNRRHSIGNGLSLYVRGASALWVYQFRDRATKKTRAVSLGSAKGHEAMSISEARNARVRFHASLLDGTAAAPRTPAGKSFEEALRALTSIHTPPHGWAA